MPKLGLEFTVHLNMMVRDDGTRETLKAIAYFRDGSEEFSVVARDFIAEGIERYKASLSPRDRSRLAEILENVKVTEAMKRAGRT